MSRVMDVLAEYRSRALARDAMVQRDLTRRWLRVEAALKDKVDLLAQSLADMRAAGQQPTTWQVMQETHYRELLGQAQAEMQRFSSYSAGLISKEQWLAAQDGIDCGADSIKALAKSAGIDISFNTMDIEAVRVMAGFSADGSPLSQLLMRSYPTTVTQISDILVRSTALGINPRKTARLMRESMAGNLQHALIVARSEQMRALRVANVAEFQASGVVSGYRRHASKSGRTCLACLIEDNRLYRLEEQFSDHPNGRCVVPETVVSGLTPSALTSRYYRGDIVTIGTASGKFLAVTPNHPVLTDRGWIAAQFVQEGSNVVGYSPIEGRPAGMSPDSYQVPAKIKDVASSLGMNWLRYMPIAAEDFHGDGKGSQVYVVCTNRLLWDRPNAQIAQPIGHHYFSLRNTTASFLSCLGHFASVLESMLHAATGLLGNGYTAQMFLLRSAGSQQAVGLSLGSVSDAMLYQNAAHSSSGNAKSLSESILGFASFIGNDSVAYKWHGSAPSPGISGHIDRSLSEPSFAEAKQPASLDHIRKTLFASMKGSRQVLDAFTANIQLDRVLQIGVRYFSGHVYNLQNKAHWYNANGIITHNCFCVPILEDVPSPYVESGQQWLEKQDAAKQRSIMGDGHYEAWQAGQFRLEDAARMYQHPIWGEAPAVVPLKELVQSDLAQAAG